jgi:hypothetical protein
MTPTGTPLLSWDWLSHSGDESEHVLLLSARPILDRGRSQIDIAICAGWTLAPAVARRASAGVRSLPAKSAIVRASFSTR